MQNYMQEIKKRLYVVIKKLFCLLIASDFFVCHCINFILKIFQSEAMTACQAIPKQAKSCSETGFEQTVPNKFLESFAETSGSSCTMTNQRLFPPTIEIESRTK